MPMLELTPDSFAPQRAEVTCNYVLAVMLWPDDETARRKWVQTATVRIMAATLRGNPTAQATAHESLFDMALNASPPDKLTEAATPLYKDGMISGETLLAAVESFAADGRLNLESLRSMQTAPARRQSHRLLNISPQKLHRDWRYFARVRHLWAAAYAGAFFANDYNWPCRPDRLVTFLADAHAVALAGSRYMRPNRRQQPILNHSALWMVPTWIHPHLMGVEQAAEALAR